jgi:hypothetical protein
VDFNLASMPESFNVPLRYSFDPRHMNALFEVGHRLGKGGHPWAKAPPGHGGAIHSRRGPRLQRDEPRVKWAKIQRRWGHPLSSRDA